MIPSWWSLEQLPVDLRACSSSRRGTARLETLMRLRYPSFGLGEQREVEDLVLASTSRRSRRRAVTAPGARAVHVGLVQLRADDRRDARVARGLVESRTPYMFPWSVMPTAGWPSAAAAPTTSPIRDAPSSIEYSVCRWRWTNELLARLTALWMPVDAPADESTPLCQTQH